MKALTFFLLTAVFCSALALVLVRHHNRLLFLELQTLQAERDDLNIEWGKLQLEHAVLADPSRIETLARGQLGMFPPPPEAVVLIHAATDP